MIFYSHSKIDKEGYIIGTRTMKNHIEGVLTKALISKANNVNFGLHPEELNKIIKMSVLFHDFGKFTTFFQNYLFKKPVDRELKQHARIGGITAFNILHNENNKLALICLYIIFRHHTQLCDIRQFPEVFNKQLHHVFQSQKDDLTNHVKEIEKILNVQEIEKYLFYPDERAIRRSFKIWALREPDIRNYFLTNYVFSLLIESDKLDASNTAQHIVQDID